MFPNTYHRSSFGIEIEHRKDYILIYYLKYFIIYILTGAFFWFKSSS